MGGRQVPVELQPRAGDRERARGPGLGRAGDPEVVGEQLERAVDPNRGDRGAQPAELDLAAGSDADRVGVGGLAVAGPIGVVLPALGRGAAVPRDRAGVGGTRVVTGPEQHQPSDDARHRRRSATAPGEV